MNRSPHPSTARLWLARSAGFLAAAPTALGADAPPAAPAKEPLTHYLVRACVVETPKGTLPAGTPEDAVPVAVWSASQAEQGWKRLRELDTASFSPCRTCYFSSSPTSRYFAGTSNIGREIIPSAGAMPAKKFVGFWFRSALRPIADAVDVDLSIEKATLREEVADADGAPAIDAKKTQVSAAIEDRSTLVVALGPAQQMGRELHGLVEIDRVGTENPADGPGQWAAGKASEATLRTWMPQFQNPVPDDTIPSPALMKAGTLILPKLELHDVSVEQAVARLRALTVDCDALQTGVEVRVRANTSTSRRITCSLTHLPVSEVLRYIARVSGLEVHVEPDALVLQTPEL